MQTTYGIVTRDQKQGCPQGSCCGSALWNMVTNERLSQQWPDNVHIQANADDSIIVLASNTKIDDFPHPDEIEVKVTCWALHKWKHLKKSQISLKDGENSNNFTNIYSDGSRTEFGVGCAFCIFESQNIIQDY
ncbi:hypothetical protein AVEN_184356-1 [Araneus ventricosus]|uniref:Reverse transcriptase domain-containing protein n=1 Tax=Araneus ventricosus TaxID=182803 RepID=A0A4Y2IBX1_ARAVE|nr:hypothetical protein AVEN_184356-1 [Araneus ventricosus]